MPAFLHARTLATFTLIGFIGCWSLPAASQEADVRLQGAIEKIDANALLLRRSDGSESTLSVDSQTAVFTNQPSSLSAVKPGDYVASAAVKGTDGKLRSKELRIFPEALRGIGEGQRPMNEPGTLMTNASVAEVVAAPEGRIVKVKYKDGTADLIVDPQVPVTAVVPAKASDLKSGTKVFVLAAKASDGTLTARRILTSNQ